VGIVTRGADGVVVCAPDGALYEGVLYVRGRYPVGSGDAFLGGVAVALARGDATVEAARLGCAAGIANAQVPGAGELDASRIPAILEAISVEPI
jgi:fructose-1-phosphate kinase PfkB-like protein